MKEKPRIISGLSDIYTNHQRLLMRVDLRSKNNESALTYSIQSVAIFFCFFLVGEPYLKHGESQYDIFFPAKKYKTWKTKLHLMPATDYTARRKSIETWKIFRILWAKFIDLFLYKDYLPVGVFSRTAEKSIMFFIGFSLVSIYSIHILCSSWRIAQK